MTMGIVVVPLSRGDADCVCHEYVRIEPH